MTSPEPNARRDDGLLPLPRSAEIIHENELRSARRQTIAATFVAVFMAVAWMRADSELGPGLLFLLGIALLWWGGSLYEWQALRRRGPYDPDAPSAQREAQQASLARHQALLAERPARLTWLLLGGIGVATVSQLFADGVTSSIERAGLVKPLVREGEWWRLVTATYLHAGLVHFWFNAAAVRAFGPLVEAYAPRSRLPLVWLVSVLGGSVASLFLMPGTTSVGASGGVLGLVGYLWVMARRRPHELPPWLGSGLTATFAINAFIGIFGFAFIDNAAHAGGAAAGALLGYATIPRAAGEAGHAAAHRDVRGPLDLLGWLAAAAIVLGALLTIAKLLR